METAAGQNVLSNEMRNTIITFILNNAANKMPIKFSELNEIADKKPKLLQAYWPVVAESLRNTYGIILEEVPNQKAGRKFICYSENFTRSLLFYNDEQKKHNTLLFIILSYIFMIGKPIYESDLEAFLYGLKININEAHPYFGENLKKLISETFVKQLYLHRDKSESEFDTEVKYVYSWGFRAKMEFNKAQLLEITAKILGKPPQFFVSQFREASAEEAAEEDE